MNHYYRSAQLPVFNDAVEWKTEAGKAKLASVGYRMTGLPPAWRMMAAG